MTHKKNLESLIEASRPKIMTPAEKELQRRSFAYGNANIENERVTRETIELAAEAIRNDGNL